MPNICCCLFVLSYLISPQFCEGDVSITSPPLWMRNLRLKEKARGLMTTKWRSQVSLILSAQLWTTSHMVFPLRDCGIWGPGLCQKVSYLKYSSAFLSMFSSFLAHTSVSSPPTKVVHCFPGKLGSIGHLKKNAAMSPVIVIPYRSHTLKPKF